MFYSSSKSNEKIWENLIESKKLPCYFTELINVEFKDFKENILNENFFYQEKLINKLFNGGVIQLKNSLDDRLINEIVKSSLNLSKSNIQNKTTCEEGSKNYFYVQSKDLSANGGYKALDRSYYFYPWDDSSKKIFSEVYKYWRYIKVLAGLKYDTYEKNTPKDGVINRMHVIQYLKGGGTISPHKDPFDSIKIQIGCVLNTYGKDYKSGGFSVYKDKNQKFCLEPNLIRGSLFCFFPNLYHTVDPIDPNEKMNLSSESGRWFLSLTCVGSDLQKGRKKTTPISL
jgi:hypothetical protein